MIRLTRPNKREVLINPNNINIIYVDDELDVCIELSNSDNVIVVIEDMKEIEDMILRDNFAMSAMNALVSRPHTAMISFSQYAKDSYKFADAMLKQRKEK